jgi:sugar phosphate isomerase/epimerase
MKLAAFPKCYMDALVRDRTMTLFEWIDMAAGLPVDGLELYDGTLASIDGEYLEKVREAHARHKLEMPMLCCSADFTQPGAAERRREVEHEKQMVDVTACLGGKFCRVLSGQRRPGVKGCDGWSTVSKKCWNTVPARASFWPWKTITRTISGLTRSLPRSRMFFSKS